MLISDLYIEDNDNCQMIDIERVGIIDPSEFEDYTFPLSSYNDYSSGNFLWTQLVLVTLLTLFFLVSGNLLCFICFDYFTIIYVTVVDIAAIYFNLKLFHICVKYKYVRDSSVSIYSFLAIAFSILCLCSVVYIYQGTDRSTS